MSAAPLHSITARAESGPYRMIGGVDGIAWSSDAGRTWELAEIEGGAFPVAALACTERTALAGTIGRGVLRSTDNGRSWCTATYGLTSLEVTALVWTSPHEVLAGTANGVHRSPNEGRAWRIVAGTEGLAIDALGLQEPGLIVAVTEDGARLTLPSRDPATGTSGSP